jgi:hypothetical protein
MCFGLGPPAQDALGFLCQQAGGLAESRRVFPRQQGYIFRRDAGIQNRQMPGDPRPMTGRALPWRTAESDGCAILLGVAVCRRFVPSLASQADRITFAVRARAARPTESSPISRRRPSWRYPGAYCPCFSSICFRHRSARCEALRRQPRERRLQRPFRGLLTGLPSSDSRRFCRHTRPCQDFCP